MSLRPLPLCVAASLALVTPAGAQPLPPLAAASPLPALAPPPGRVGRIASVMGAVSFHLAGAIEWQVASANLPVTSGVALWAAPGAGAALGLGSGNRTVIGPSTELDVDTFDDQAFNATQPQGKSYLHLQLVTAPDTYTVRTPRGIVAIASAGRYEIVSGDTEHPTTVTVLDGAATLSGIPATAEVGAGQTLTITGDGAATPFAASVGPAVQDEFLRHVLAEERPAAPRPAIAPAVLSYMTGGDALDGVGEWSENAEYGPVWYPPAANYVPYRQGRWAYVAPWGWTWVDDASWGFAPTHYGRWAEFNGRWGWVPGRAWQPDRRPVYAPALVGFLSGAALGYGGRALSVGWAPLAPRDVYRPPYAVNERIAQVLNQPTGANIQITNAPVTINRNALTIVPSRILADSAPVAGAYRPGPAPASIGPATALQFRPQTAPTRATIGATQAVLRQVNPAGLSAPPAHVGPGPALNRFQQPGLTVAHGPGQAPRQAPGPSINPAAMLGGAAAGAVAGGRLRPQESRTGDLPTLRQRGIGPGAIGRPQPPVMPAVVVPRGPGAIPSPDRGAPTPILAGPTFGSQAPERGRPQSQRQPEVRPAPAIPRLQFAAPPRAQIVTPAQPVPAPYRPERPERQMRQQAPSPPHQEGGRREHPER